MARSSSSATEETGSVLIAPEEAAATEVKETSRAFLQAARRNLNDDELATPAARRFLIAELERLDEQCRILEKYAESHHDQRVTIATLVETNKKSKWIEILSSLCLAIGSAGIGWSPSFFAVAGGFLNGIFIVATSLILIVGALAPKVFK